MRIVRCTRCDEIVTHQVLARLPDGRLVFGCCHRCATELGCLVLASDGKPPPKPLRRWFPRLTVRSVNSRHLALLGVAGLMMAWSLILAFVGGWKLPGRAVGKTHGPVDPTGPYLVAGAGVMALVSLATWIAVLGRGQRRRFVIKLVHVAAILTILAALTWGIFRHKPVQDPWIVAIVAGALLVSWLAHRSEKRAATPPKAAATPL
jgi:hypothetical protein